MGKLLEQWRQWTVARRRRRSLRAAGRTRAYGVPAGRLWSGLAGVLAVVAGGAVIVVHARHLAAVGAATAPDRHARDAYLFQAVAPGARFVVPERAGVQIDGRFVIASGMRADEPVRVDLCEQVLDRTSGRMLPLHIGYSLAELERIVGTPARNAVLGSLDETLPKVDITGTPAAGKPLRVSWHGAPAATRWIADDSGQAPEFVREAWLAWNDGALRLRRHADGACPAGTLELQWLRKQDAATPRALVAALVPGREPVTAWLAPGAYEVPSAARPGLEDQALFQQLQALHLVRLAPDGTVDLAPRDLLAWAAAPASARAVELAQWRDAPGGAETAAALRRLYRMADGAFVRQQVAVFNAERRLLAVRSRAGAGQDEWAATVGGAAAGTAAGLPPSASALFGALPQGWAAWTRVAQWPEAEAGAVTRLRLVLPRRTARIDLMLVGHLAGVEGGRVLERTPACSGRLCTQPDAVTRLAIAPDADAASITLSATPLPLAALASPGDARYRFLRVEEGRLVWRPVDNAVPVPAPPASVRIADRAGLPLWNAGAPTPDAVRAGLAPLVGVRAEQANSVAGMLERLGGAHDAKLTLDLTLQALAQNILDCVGLRRGHWVNAACEGGAPAPAGRRAGFVVVDTQTGEILAAAGAGMGDPLAAPWTEVRDFDRANPGASPLRLPAFQHDGGVHNSPGSTFKIVSALGLELAAQRDPGLDTLLAGLPLAAINRAAQERGFAFRTAASTYPLDLGRAHVTNYRDGQLDRRAAAGRFGLPQALTYSLNTWFAWSAELSDASLEHKAAGGMPMLQALDPHALGLARPIAGMARLLGFEQAWRLDGGLLPADFRWSRWDALQTTPAHIDPIRSRHEVRQMAIGIRMQATPLQMALAAAAVGEGRVVTPCLLQLLDGRAAAPAAGPKLAVRLDRIRAGMKGVIDHGTAAGAFRGAVPEAVRAALYGKTGTAPTTALGPGGDKRAVATVWFAGWLEPHALPGQNHRWAMAAYASHSDGTGGEHAAPVVASFLAALARNDEQTAKTPVSGRLTR